ncbi:hypothetical protein EV363DRAFT_1179079 [Boletus edulis]|nr:hypothetical protein EV363DRAFT_1179079 [Boletus edulis]
MPSFRCDCCRELGCACNYPDFAVRSESSVDQYATQSGVTNDDHGSDEDFQAMMQYLTGTRFAAIDMHPQPMSTLHQSGPIHDELDLTHRMEDAAVVVPHNSSADENYGPGAKPTDTPGARLSPPPTTTRMSCPTVFCWWHDKGTPNICGEMISCDDVPTHFKNHGVENLHESRLLDCMWENCFVQIGRKNYVRHVRECHLYHIRGKGHVVPHRMDNI